jgi:RNA polymerase sigma factor (sigma-70 family)
MPEIGWGDIAANRERLLRIARRRCATREDAEDVVSEAMLRCATFDGIDPERLEAFLTAVTVRLCADVHRAHARGTRAVLRLAPERDVTPGPEDGICESVDAEVLSRLLAELPERQRAVLADRARGLSVTQIAERHALTYKATESALARARGAMRAALATAFGVVAGALAALRPRRLAILAVPAAATLIVVSPVVRSPWSGEQADGPARRAGAAPEAASTLLRDAGDATATAKTQAPRPASAPRVVRPETEPVAYAAPPPRGTKRKQVVIGDPKTSQTRIRDERPDDWTPQGYAKACVEEGVWMTFDYEPGGKPVFYQGCG